MVDILRNNIGIVRLVLIACLPTVMVGVFLGASLSKTPGAGNIAGQVTQHIRTIEENIADNGLVNETSQPTPITSPTASVTTVPADNDSSKTSNKVKKTASDSTTKSPSQQTTPTFAPIPSTSYPTPTTPVTQPTQVATSTPIPTLAQSPTPTPVFTQLIINGCYEFGLTYCRQRKPSNGYASKARVRVRDSATGNLLASATLDHQGYARITRLPINKDLEVVLLPSTDYPNYCGDVEFVEFLSYRTYIIVELILRSSANPCITS